MATALAGVLMPLSAWFWSTTTEVPQPYLDEVFHVRQAQHYCAGRFGVWDPKITTPPGLYYLSYLASPLLGCDITALRSLSALCLDFTLLIVVVIYGQRKSDVRSPWLVEHCAFNVATFPPLFFFTALYYTDVASTLSVLVFYWYFLRTHRAGTTWYNQALLVFLGLASLFFRQTNIFWVAVFPAGLILVNDLDRGHSAIRQSTERKVEGFGDTFFSIARTSYKLEVVYDPPVRHAQLEDYLKTVVSIAACLAKTATQPKRLVPLGFRLLPYVTILGCFAGFILWNGSVVLGDKSNHVATIHLAQMLYLWPYITFFSWPLLWPYLLILPLGLLAEFSPIAPLEMMLIFKRRKLLPRKIILLGFVALACFIAHFNTIVHPFTLADNRHYTFYVFRLLTRPWWMKYAVSPLYVITAWACIQAMGARPVGAPIANKSPITNDEKETAAASQTPESPRTASGTAHQPLRIPDGVHSARTTFLLLWLATTALQLVSAPLVEPRYFILPWVFWRMHLPLQRSLTAGLDEDDHDGKSWIQRLDPRLWLESAWHLLVQAGTGYIFLRWGFTWWQEPGRVQRFMW